MCTFEIFFCVIMLKYEINISNGDFGFVLSCDEIDLFYSKSIFVYMYAKYCHAVNFELTGC